MKFQRLFPHFWYEHFTDVLIQLRYVKLSYRQVAILMVTRITDIGDGRGLNPRTNFCFFCYVNSGWNAKAAPPVSPELIGIFPCGFHQSVGNHKHILFDVSSITIFQVTPTTNKIGGHHTGCKWDVSFERDITNFRLVLPFSKSSNT